MCTTELGNETGDIGTFFTSSIGKQLKKRKALFLTIRDANRLKKWYPDKTFIKRNVDEDLKYDSKYKIETAATKLIVSMRRKMEITRDIDIFIQ